MEKKRKKRYLLIQIPRNIDEMIHIVLKFHASFRDDHNALLISSFNNLLSRASGELVVAFYRDRAR